MLYTGQKLKNSPSWRDRDVSEAVAIQKKLSFSADCRAIRGNDEKCFITGRKKLCPVQRKDDL